MESVMPKELGFEERGFSDRGLLNLHSHFLKLLVSFPLWVYRADLKKAGS